MRNVDSATSRFRGYFITLSWLPCTSEGGWRKNEFENSGSTENRLVSFYPVKKHEFGTGGRLKFEFRALSLQSSSVLSLFYRRTALARA